MDTIEEIDLPILKTAAVPREKTEAGEFHTAEVVAVAAAHGTHDTYFSYLPTILPLLIQKFSLSNAEAGLLSTFTQFPNLVQPLIGHLADRKNLRMLVVLAPTLSGALITLVGVAPSFGVVGFLLLLAGFSTAGFHAIAPAITGARAGRRVGRGLSYFMVGGELGFAVGPLVVVAAVGTFSLAGLPWLMTLGMLASFILYFLLKNVTTVRDSHATVPLSVRQTLLQMRGLILPILGITFITGFLNANMVNYLPTFIASEGGSFAWAGISLTVLELGGTVGVFLMGMISDRVGHRKIALAGTAISVIFALGFLVVEGWLQIVMLAGMGASAFVSNPAYLSMIQIRFSANRSLANSLYMAGSFILRSLVVVIVGALADQYGMRPVFIASALGAMLAVPLILLLPKD